MRKAILVSLLWAHTFIAFATGPCSKVSTTLTPQLRKMYARSLSSHLTSGQSPAQIHVQRLLTIAPWTAVWATPANAERGVFFFSNTKSGLVYHDVWGGVASPSEQADVAHWIAKLSPIMPPSFAQCVAQSITANH